MKWPRRPPPLSDPRRAPLNICLAEDSNLQVGKMSRIKVLSFVLTALAAVVVSSLGMGFHFPSTAPNKFRDNNPRGEPEEVSVRACI